MQSRILVILLVLLFGFTGIHRFYLRYNKVAYYMMALFFSFLVFVGLGFLNLASGSLLAIFLWWIYETFIVVTGKLKFYQSEILNDKQDIQNIFNSLKKKNSNILLVILKMKSQLWQMDLKIFLLTLKKVAKKTKTRRFKNLDIFFS